MATNVGNLAAKLTVDGSGFSAGMAKATKEAEGAVARIQGAFAGLAGGGVGGIAGLAGGFGSLGTAGIFGGIAAGLGLVVAQFKEMAEAGAAIMATQGKMAARFEMTTDSIGGLLRVANRYGIEQEAVNAGLIRFERLLGQAQRGSHEARAAFAALGLSGRDLAEPEQALRLIIDRMATLSAAQRELVGQQIFGRGGGTAFSLLALRTGGSAGLDRSTSEGINNGAIASEAQVNSARALNREIRENNERIEDRRRAMQNETASVWLNVRAWMSRVAVRDAAIRADPNGAVANGQQGVRIESYRIPESPQAAFDFEQTQARNEMHAATMRATEGGITAAGRLSAQNQTLGMNPYEVQRRGLANQLGRVESLRGTRGLTTEQNEELELRRENLRLAQASLNYAQQENEAYHERLHTMTAMERIREAESHFRDPAAANRAGFGEFLRLEGQLGLNRPTRQAAGVVRGSVGAAGAINAANLQASDQGRTVQERLVSVQQAQTAALLRNNGLLQQFAAAVGAEAVNDLGGG